MKAVNLIWFLPEVRGIRDRCFSKIPRFRAQNRKKKFIPNSSLFLRSPDYRIFFGIFAKFMGLEIFSIGTSRISFIPGIGIFNGIFRAFLCPGSGFFSWDGISRQKATSCQVKKFSKIFSSNF